MEQLIEDYEKHEPLIGLLCLVSKNTRITRTNFLHLTNVCQKSIQVYIPKPPQNARFRTTGALQFEARQ